MNNSKTSLLTLIVIGLTFCLVAPVQSQTGSNVTVHFIDVDQGDSIFIDTSEKDVLIDAGSKSATQNVLSYLASLNINHIA